MLLQKNIEKLIIFYILYLIYHLMMTTIIFIEEECRPEYFNIDNFCARKKYNPMKPNITIIKKIINIC